MEILDEDLVDIDLNDYSSDDNHYHFENISPVSNNSEFLVNNLEIPLVENLVITETKEYKDEYYINTLKINS
ncbi:hypothetical protein PIROE2DRAFT_6969 [Piromyces sp. E2]|nr:hypothetical protein PIROE2DRAFT_6969 [Piromyces sp. E2]|eukprot:OUM65901.1 hypothetical protein PIROE2DRAFT_6969 [Piromyces sp. E2]